MPEADVIDFNAWRFWLELLLAVSALTATFVGWWVSRTRATRDSIIALDNKHSGRQDLMQQEHASLRCELDRLATKVSGLPNHDDIGKVHDRLTDVDGRLRELLGGVNGMARGLDTINNYLLNNKER